MDKNEQRGFADTFRKLHAAPPLLLLPNAWDAMSARLFEDAGFPAIATSSAGMAWALGYPDGEIAPWAEIVAATARIVNAVRIPVTADIEEGFAASDAEFADHIAEIIETGAIGVNIEDGMANGPVPIRSIEAAVARIRLAREAADKAGVPIFINARTDLYLKNIGEAGARFEETVQRGKAYLAAGADGVYPIGLGNPKIIADLVAALGAPVNVMGRAGVPDVAELEKLGVARVSIASMPTLVVMSVIRDLAHDLRANGKFDALNPAIKHPDAQRLFAKR